MARVPFNIDLPGVVRWTLPNGSGGDSSVVSDAYSASETCVGTPRHKPVGWVNPRSYQMTYLARRRAVGVCRNITNPNNLTLGQIYTGVVGGSGGRFNSDGHFSGLVTEAGSRDLTLANLALIDARQRLKQKRVDLGVAFAERKQTARLLGDTASRMAKSFNHLKRGQVRAAMRDLGIANSRREPRGSNVPNKWLELQYGWKPLISDVFGACSALSKRPQGDWRVTSKAQRTSRRTWTAKYTSFDYGLGGAEAERGAFVRIDALPSNDLTISLASLGITNPGLIAWELVPYSFVVDWCFPVGSWLDQLDALAGYQSYSFSSTAFTKTHWWGKGARSGVLNPQGGYYDNDYEESKTYVNVVRSVSNGVPLATFPRIKDPSSLGHMANGLALLASAFGRR